jgi:mannosyl-3-phosphoglycerate phosphatase
MTKTLPKLIFTDLDGTLVDSVTARWDAAETALRLTQDQGIPLVLCSSRTFAECLYFQRKMALRGPIIYENGAGVALPKSQFRRPTQPPSEEVDDFWLCGIAKPYAEVRAFLMIQRRQKHFQFSGFGDLTEAQLSALTGWEADIAELAKQRRHNEALFWLDNAKQFDVFATEVMGQNLRLTRGSQLMHLGSACDKGQAARWLINFYSKLLGAKPHVLALGDTSNDVPLLRLADVAVVIRPPHCIPLQYKANDHQQLMIADGIGPEGWNQIIQQILEEDVLLA